MTSVPPPGDGRIDGEIHKSAPLPVEILRSLWQSFRETLPADESEAGVFLAGMCWAFVAFFTMLVLVSWLYGKAAGLAL